MFDNIVNMYISKNIGHNIYCKQCQKENESIGFSPPVSIYHIGCKFSLSDHRILFVGKNARGTVDDNPLRNGIKDSRQFALRELDSPEGDFWKYIKKIVLRIYDDNASAFDKIAISNLIKCNNAMGEEGRNPDGTTNDYTSPLMMTNCLEKLRIFWEEVKCLRPYHIIYFTGRDYDDFIDKPPYLSLTKEITQRTYMDNKLLWWERNFIDENRIIRCLRTYHPGYWKYNQIANEYVERISAWIKV